MGVMDFFSGRSQPAAPQQQQNNQQNNQQQQNPNSGTVQNNVAPNGNNQQTQNDLNNGKMAGTTNEPANPMDQYSKLWENATNQQDTPPQFQLDPKVLQDVSGKMSFTDGVPQELMQRATSGDMTALVEMMNFVGQNAYKMSLQHGSALTDRFVAARSDFDSKSLAPKVKGELTNAALSNLPNFNHPVVKQQLRDTANRLQAQNPDASPQQIADMAKQYISDLASAIGGNQNNQQGSGQNSNGSAQQNETDWDAYLSQ